MSQLSQEEAYAIAKREHIESMERYEKAQETIKDGLTGKTITEVIFYMDAIELRFDDGGHIMIQLEQLEDAYQLGLFYTPEGGAELRFSP